MSNKIAVFIPCEDTKLDYNDRIELIEKSRNLARKLKQSLGLSFRIGIGSIKKLNNSMESYNEALKSLLNTTTSVAHADDLSGEHIYEEGYPTETEKGILESLVEGNTADCIRQANLFYDWMTEQHMEDKDSIKLKILEIVLIAEHEVSIRNGQANLFTSRNDYLTTISSITEEVNLKEWFLSKLMQACHNIIVRREEKSIRLIKKAKDYILLHFKKDISLEEMSRELDISPYYFSKLFKDLTGTNFIEYLTNIRIEKAKVLLLDQEKSMKEICLLVGYSDPNYFSRIFKKWTGKTPTEYKEGI